ncbi:DNA topoisomerase I [Archaeoglobales archaeon]|nr:MAG: DNA topoisomerase I [Archaeoglobales archaeon]
MSGWLIITEKDNTARRIASILFRDVKVLKKGVNCYYSKSNDAYVVGLKGHIVEIDFPPEYNRWSEVPLKSLLNAELEKKIKETKVVNLLKELAKKVEHVTIATDYDREGELIGVEALEIIKKVNPNVKVDRAKYSAITPSEIKKAFNNLSRVDFNLASSAMARQKIDLIWGAVLTRLISLHSGKLGKDFLSVGRVQSPTLRLIVEREKEIKEFKPKKYWEIFATFRNSEEFKAKHIKRFEDEKEVKETFDRVGDGIVKKFEKRERIEAKPSPFNTTLFLKEASKFMSPDRAMMVAETLYMNGLISYPRTDNTVYPPSINVVGIAEMLADVFPKEAKIVLKQDKIVPSRGKRESKDHPPIYPTGVATKDKLSKDEWRIYELVIRRFLATLAPNAVWEVKSVEVDSNGEIFKASGRKLIEKGWREIYIYYKIEESHLPDLKVGEKLKLVDKEILEKETKPPARYTTGNLISVMEKLNLGTKSTRHEIIKKLYSRKYVFGNPLKPTQTAVAVIESLKKGAETITLPDMTAKLEKDMYEIAEGKRKEEEIVKESKEFLDKILDSIDYEELSKSLKAGIKKDKVVGTCPRCGKELVLRKSRGRNSKRFIGCSGFPNCNFTLPLPQNGTIYLTKKCEKHNIKKIRIKTKKGYWDVGCPYCNYLEWKKKNEK